MPQATRTRFDEAGLVLPPPFRLTRLREAGDAFAHACRNAESEGAGTLVFVGRFDLAEFAVVLEPDDPLRLARRTLYAAMNALGDALASHAPPEKPITFDWPDAVHIDGGLVGGGRLAWPENAQEDETPDWLVFGATIRMVSMVDGLSGLQPITAALEEEGFSEFGAEQLLETFARHLMMTLDGWQESGFAPIAKHYRSRLIVTDKQHASFDENGDLLANGQKRFVLSDALATPSWLDPATGGPRA